MKTLITLAALVFSLPAHAATGRAIEARQIEGRAPGENMLKNGTADLYGKKFWTASGGTFTATTSTPISGAKSFSWDSSSATQTLTSDAITVTSGMSGVAMAMSCRVMTPSGTATHTLGLWNGTTLSDTQTVTSATTPVRVTVNFSGPSSGTVAMRFTSVNANEPAILIDDCYLGLAEGFNIASISQATWVGSITFNGCAGAWTQSGSGVYGDFSPTTGCTYSLKGSIGSPDTMIPGFKVTGGPGKYMVVYAGVIGNGGTSGATRYRITDGTTIGEEEVKYFVSTGTNEPIIGNAIWSLEKTTTLSSAPFKIQTMQDGGSAMSYMGGGTFNVYRFPSAAETVYKADALGSSWSGYYSNAYTWSTGSGTFADMTSGATGTTAERINNNFGTVTFGSGTPAITFTPKRPGTYWVCANFHANTGPTSYRGFQLTDGTTQIATSGGYGDTAHSNLCGFWRAASTASATLKIQGRVSGAATTTINASPAGMAGTNAVEWTIVSIDQTFPAPQILPVTKRAYIRDEKAAGTQGGTSTTGSWQTRTLNTLTDTNNIGITLASNQFTLPAGTYRINGSVPGCSVNSFRGKLRNITDSADTILGTNGYSISTTTVTSYSLLLGMFTISTPKTFEIQMYSGATAATLGMGANSNMSVVEVYTQIEIEKIN